MITTLIRPGAVHFVTPCNRQFIEIGEIAEQDSRISLRHLPTKSRPEYPARTLDKARREAITAGNTRLLRLSECLLTSRASARFDRLRIRLGTGGPFGAASRWQ